LSKERTGLPDTVLLVGIVITLLLTRVIRNAQSVKRRADEAELMNRVLEEHIDERRRFEETLEARVAERTRELREAREAALVASRLKTEWVTNMSHETRTPINAVIGTTGLLFETALDREQRDYVETIKLSTDALLSLVNDILDFSKIEAGRMTLELIDFDLPA